MKTIYINGRFLTQPLSGMQRFAGELLSAIDSALAAGSFPNVRFVVLVPRQEIRNYEWKNIEVHSIGRFKGHLWEQVDLAFHTRGDILINLISSGPLLHDKSILVMHDAAIFAHPNHFSKAYKAYHHFIRPRIAKKAKSLVTISEFSRRELARWCHVDEHLFTVVGDSAEHVLHTLPDSSILQKHGIPVKKYALTVGNQSPNKNISLAIQAFEKAAPEGWALVIVGGGSDKVFGRANDEKLDFVKKLGRVNDQQLRALYENAGLFLFPSRYEGFGVPPIEAMALGCPVLSSNSSAMPEVLGDAAEYFESDNVDDFSQKIKMLCMDVELRKSMITKGYARASIYSWDKSAHTMLSVIRSFL